MCIYELLTYIYIYICITSCIQRAHLCDSLPAGLVAFGGVSVLSLKLPQVFVLDAPSVALLHIAVLHIALLHTLL